MQLVPFEPRHLAAIRPGRFEILALEGIDITALAAGAAPGGPAMSMVGSDGEILGAGGIVPMWRGVGSAWIYASDSMRDRPVALHRAVQRGLAMAERELGLHRIQIAVHADFHASSRWVRRLGFAFEGVMHKFGPNGDSYHRFAKVNHHVS